MTTNSKLNVYHPAVVADMKRRGFVPVKQVEARKQWADLHKSIAVLGAKAQRDAGLSPGKVNKILIIKSRTLDFGQIPHGQKPKSLFKEKK